MGGMRKETTMIGKGGEGKGKEKKKKGYFSKFLYKRLGKHNNFWKNK